MRDTVLLVVSWTLVVSVSGVVAVVHEDDVAVLLEVHSGLVARAGTYAGVGFNTNEHLHMGDEAAVNALKQAVEKNYVPKEWAQHVGAEGFTLPGNGIKVSYGQLVELFGDFFAPDDPISQGEDKEAQERRFEEAFALLTKDDQSTAAHIANAEHFSHAFDEVARWKREHHGEDMPAKKLRKLAATVSAFLTRSNSEGPIMHNALGYVPWLISIGVTGLRVLKNTGRSFDHHGDDAVAAYSAGMAFAFQRAIKAHELYAEDDAPGAPWAQELDTAVAISGAAGHFLSDRFAAGHLETWVWRFCQDWKECSPLLKVLKTQHDEQNEWGLYVRNDRGDKWKAYGDGRALPLTGDDETETDTFKYPRLALEASITDVLSVFHTGSAIDQLSALELIPHRDPEAENIPPLFRWSTEQKRWEYRTTPPAVKGAAAQYDTVTCKSTPIRILKSKKHVCYVRDGEHLFVKAGKGECSTNKKFTFSELELSSHADVRADAAAGLPKLSLAQKVRTIIDEGKASVTRAGRRIGQAARQLKEMLFCSADESCVSDDGDDECKGLCLCTGGLAGCVCAHAVDQHTDVVCHETVEL